MSTNKRFLAIYNLCFLCIITTLTGCLNLDNDAKDWKETVIISVLPEKGDYYPQEGNGMPLKGIQIKEDKGDQRYHIIPLTEIEGFVYTEGYHYRLKVEKTHLANPPQDGSNIK